MAKHYCFQFPGTKEDFLRLLGKYPIYNKNYYYLDDYIVEIENGAYKFGVARGGHSGGYWYLPEISEKDGSLCFNGKILYISPHDPEKGIKRTINTIEEILTVIILFPFLLITICCVLIASLIKKRKGEPKELTTEEKLYDLMVNHLHCSEVLKTDR